MLEGIFLASYVNYDLLIVRLCINSLKCCVGYFVKALGRMDIEGFCQGCYLHLYFCDGL